MGVNTIVVTGASGFIGSSVCEWILEKNPLSTVIGVGRHKGHASEIVNRNFEFIPYDLMIPGIERQLPGKVDAIIHLAGDRRPHMEPSSFTSQMQSNVLMTSYAADYAAHAGARVFIYASSVYVYSGCDQIPFREEQLVLPAEHLGATKLASEALIKARALAGQFKAIALRVFTAYGPRSERKQFITQAIAKLSTGEPIVRFGPPNTERDFIFIDDVALAFVAALAWSEQQEEPYDVFNVGTGVRTSISDVVDLLVRIMHVNSAIEYDQPIHSTYLAAQSHQACVSKANSVLGWRANVELEAGLRNTLTAFTLSCGGTYKG